MLFVTVNSQLQKKQEKRFCKRQGRLFAMPEAAHADQGRKKVRTAG